MIIWVEGLRKSFRANSLGGSELELFSGLELVVKSGELVALVGASGAGKSSLLHLLAALDRPTSGQITVAGVEPGSLNPTQAAAFRNRTVGYVWQFHYLLPEFTALENVAMPLIARGLRRAEALKQAAPWLAEVGLADRAAHRSGELSGGEQQRVSLARALVTEPQILLADEPTGDLDARTAETVFALLERLHREYALTTVLVTHHLEFARRCDRMLNLHDGLLTEVRLQPTRSEP